MGGISLSIIELKIEVFKTGDMYSPSDFSILLGDIRKCESKMVRSSNENPLLTFIVYKDNFSFSLLLLPKVIHHNFVIHHNL